MTKLKGVLLLLIVTVSADDPIEGDEDGGDNPLDLPGIPSLIEQLALREEKVMKQLSTQMLPPPLGYVVNKPEPDSINRPLKRPPVSQNKEVTETDLYLLGAIERLVYRVDLMEKRLKRTEELLYHVMEGANTQRQDPCPGNFTRVARNCYHFSERQFNWKSASSMCKSLGANLVELESREEFSELVTFLQADPYSRGAEFWTGGLNPGLLWIWSNSGRPVTPKRPSTRPEDTVLGAGRCLSLAYSPNAKLYQYQVKMPRNVKNTPPRKKKMKIKFNKASPKIRMQYSREQMDKAIEEVKSGISCSEAAKKYNVPRVRGADCGVRQRYICEHEENTTSRGLNRLHKALKL